MKDNFKSKKLSDEDMGKVSGGSRGNTVYYKDEKWDSTCYGHRTQKHQWEVNKVLKKFVCPNCNSKCSDREPSKEELETGRANLLR